MILFQNKYNRVYEHIQLYSNTLQNVYDSGQSVHLVFGDFLLQVLLWKFFVCWVWWYCIISKNSDVTTSSISLDLLACGQKTLPTGKTNFQSENDQFCTWHNVFQMTSSTRSVNDSLVLCL